MVSVWLLLLRTLASPYLLPLGLPFATALVGVLIRLQLSLSFTLASYSIEIGNVYPHVQVVNSAYPSLTSFQH